MDVGGLGVDLVGIRNQVPVLRRVAEVQNEFGSQLPGLILQLPGQAVNVRACGFSRIGGGQSEGGDQGGDSRACDGHF